jgi:hypothetical protein
VGFFFWGGGDKKGQGICETLQSVQCSHCRKSPKPPKEGKKPRVWDLGGNTKDLANLEYTKDKPTDGMPGRDDIQPDTKVKH